MKKVAFVTSGGLTAGESYKQALLAASVEPVQVPIGALSAFSIIADIDGLLLTGGGDINPKFYGQEPDSHVVHINDDRDRFEGWMLDQALEHDLPILAICRGIQLLNVSRGGTLVQHLPTYERHQVRAEDKAAIAHTVAIDPKSFLGILLGEQTFGVNSRHHQALDRLGEDVVVVGRCPDDGVIEAVEVVGYRFVIGVQWHPEDMVGSSMTAKRLFTAFADSL